MHGLTNPVGWEKAMSPGGALEAFIEARQQGLVRFLGVTGHGNKTAAMHLRSLERYDFDSVLLPYSYWQMRNSRYAAEFNELVGSCRERKVAVQTIKSIARRRWGKRPKTHNTYFYEPLESQSAIEKSVLWALRLPDSFIITAGDLRLVPKILQSAKHPEKHPSDAEMHALMEEFAIEPIFS